MEWSEDYQTTFDKIKQYLQKASSVMPIGARKTSHFFVFDGLE